MYEFILSEKISYYESMVSSFFPCNILFQPYMCELLLS